MDPGDQFTKVVLRQASDDLEKFQFSIIFKPFERQSYIWYKIQQLKGISIFIDNFFVDLRLKVKNQISRSNKTLGKPVFISQNLFDPQNSYLVSR